MKNPSTQFQFKSLNPMMMLILIATACNQGSEVGWPSCGEIGIMEHVGFDPDLSDNLDTWPFSKPHYLLINLAYGGSWGLQNGVDTNLLPLTYEIDYVRYYQK